MPYEIQELSKKGSGSKPKYDYDLILDGTKRGFVQGEDFDCKPQSFISSIRAKAEERGLRLTTRNPSEGVVEVHAEPRTEVRADADVEADAEVESE